MANGLERLIDDRRLDGPQELEAAGLLAEVGAHRLDHRHLFKCALRDAHAAAALDVAHDDLVNDRHRVPAHY